MIITTAAKYIPRTLRQFSRAVKENRALITTEKFADEIGRLQHSYLQKNRGERFCREADELVDEFFDAKEHDFASIIISYLCKMKEFIPGQLEYFATKGVRMSEANGDVLHLMARLNNLRKVYDGRPDRLFDYIQVLYKQEKCLKQITRHYDETVASYKTVSRQISDKNTYEKMLAYVQTEICKLTRKRHPNDALKKINSAIAIFEKNNDQKSLAYARMLLRKIENDLGFIQTA